MKLWPIGEVRRVERAFSPKSQHYGFYMLNSFIRKVPAPIEAMYASIDEPIILVRRTEDGLYAVAGKYTYANIPHSFKDGRGQYPSRYEPTFDWDKELGMVTGFPLRPWITSKLRIPCSVEDYYRLKDQLCYERYAPNKCQSPIEKLFLKEAINRGLRLEPQRWINANGTNYKIDFVHPTNKIAIELDGHNFHSSREQRTKDAQRERALQAIGWNVIRFTGSEIFHNVNKCVDDLIRILQAG